MEKLHNLLSSIVNESGSGIGPTANTRSQFAEKLSAGRRRAEDRVTDGPGRQRRRAPRLVSHHERLGLSVIQFEETVADARVNATASFERRRARREFIWPSGILTAESV